MFLRAAKVGKAANIAVMTHGSTTGVRTMERGAPALHVHALSAHTKGSGA